MAKKKTTKASPPENETKEEKFKRLANARTNEVLKKINILGNLGSPQYSYTQEQVDKIFSAINSALELTKEKFENPGKNSVSGFKL